MGIAPGFTSQGILRNLQPPPGSVPNRYSIVTSTGGLIVQQGIVSLGLENLNTSSKDER